MPHLCRSSCRMPRLSVRLVDQSAVWPGEWKPDRSRTVITVSRDGNGLDFQCDPGFPEAWRKEPYCGEIKRLAAIALRHDGLICVNSGRNLIIVAPEQDFALGEVAEQDEIIREYSGERLVGVRVVKARETHR